MDEGGKKRAKLAKRAGLGPSAGVLFVGIRHGGEPEATSHAWQARVLDKTTKTTKTTLTGQARVPKRGGQRLGSAIGPCSQQTAFWNPALSGRRYRKVSGGSFYLPSGTRSAALALRDTFSALRDFLYDAPKLRNS